MGDFDVTAADRPIVVVISGDVMGRGDDQLGHVLLRNYLHTLTEATPRPTTLAFFNNGVKLVAEGSPVLEDLACLEEQGVNILSCGTCLSHFGLKDAVVAGEISNMRTITESMLRAATVINL